MTYSIERPPLAATFELPTREELLSIKRGDLVKIMFRVENENIERMWVKVTSQQDIAEWTGLIDNDAVSEKTRTILPAGTEISFHPLDIVQIFDEQK